MYTFEPGFVLPKIKEPCSNLPLNSTADNSCKEKIKRLKKQSHLAVHPPSITTELPVIIDDASEAKKVTAVATSLTVTTL